MDAGVAVAVSAGMELIRLLRCARYNAGVFTQESRRMRSFVAVPVALLAAVAVAATSYGVRQQYLLGGGGGWDYLTLDQAGKRLFIARTDRVMVVDTADGKVIGTIPHTEGRRA